jgi:FkbM family methyltransferase
VNLAEYQNLNPNMPYNGLTFLTPNEHCAWRVSSLDTKEPDTVEWLANMKPSEVLWDVGANMGQYSLIAAARGVVVHAFEPESQNFALLCRNIGINNMGALVTAWPLALSDETGFDYFYAQSLQVGGSCSSYGEEVNFHLQEKKYAIRQGCAAVSGNVFAAKYGLPDHIKIDVDGLEHKVVTGISSVLYAVKSVLVELNTALPEHMEIYEVMQKRGLHPDVETADKARRTEGAFKGIGNVIFYRDAK